MVKKVFIGGVELNTLSTIPTIDTPLERFVNKKVIVTGDSITAGYGGAPIWYAHLRTWFQFKYVYNDAITATGISKNVGASPGIYDRIDDWGTNYTTNPDYILVMVSMNDLGFNGLPLGTTADITSENPTFHTSYYMNVRMLIEKLQTNYPTIPIGIITPIPWGTRWGRDTTYYAWNQAVIDVCKHFSVPCLDLFTASGMRPWNDDYVAKYYAYDTTHPNPDGQKLIAYKIYEFVKQYM